MAKRIKSASAGAVYETVAGLHRIGLVDKQTMRHFDERCLTPPENLTGRQIKKLRTGAGVSQFVFARYLNVGSTVVSQWERGKRKPTGAAKKLLALAKNKGLDSIA